ncbi:MAG: MerR family transcriptional regulator, partial [Clostridia bacterium]|nr:MerR family transcriptional regulator [Clostridia bacterium]
MLKIGEFSKLCKTTVKTLRYYDEVDLLKPIFVDDNGYRYYEISQLNDLIKILELRALDMSVSDVKKMLKSNEQDKYLELHLDTLKREL